MLNKLNTFFLILSLIVGNPVWSAWYQIEKSPQRVQTIQQDLGPLVGKNDAPVIYDWLSKIILTLQKGLLELYPENKKIQKTKLNFILIDSSLSNAMIQRATKNGYLFDVIVTTGLIRELVEKSGIDKSIYQLTGILSHEIAHIIDYQDPEAIGSDDLTKSQAVEIRTDIEATRILHRLGLPAAALAEALSVFDTQKSDFILSMLSTHPDTLMRVEITKALATTLRYEKGLEEPIQFKLSQSELNQFQLELSAEKSRFLKIIPFNEINDFKSLTKALRNLSFDKRASYPLTVAQFNLILLKFNDIARNYKGDLWNSKSEFVYALRYLMAIYINEEISPIDHKLNYYLINDPKVLNSIIDFYGVRLNSIEPQSIQKNQLPFYNDVKMVEFINHFIKTSRISLDADPKLVIPDRRTGNDEVIKTRSYDAFASSYLANKYSQGLTKLTKPDYKLIDKNSKLIIEYLLEQKNELFNEINLEIINSRVFFEELNRHLNGNSKIISKDISSLWIKFAENLWSNRLDWAYAFYINGKSNSQIMRLIYKYFNPDSVMSFDQSITELILEDIKINGIVNFIKYLDKNNISKISRLSTAWDDQGKIMQALISRGLLSRTEKWKIFADRVFIDAREQTKEYLVNLYMKEFNLMDSSLTVEQVDVKLRHIRKKFSFAEDEHKLNLPELRLIELDALYRSNQSNSIKSLWGHKMLFGADLYFGTNAPVYRADHFNYLTVEKNYLKKILSRSIELNVFKTSVSFWKEIADSARQNGYAISFIRDNFRYENSFVVFKELILNELNQINLNQLPQIEAHKILYEYTYFLKYPIMIDSQINKLHAKHESALKKVDYPGSDELVNYLIKLFISTNPTYKQAIQFFDHLTNQTDNEKTDMLFTWIDKNFTNEDKKMWKKQVLTKGKIQSKDLRVEEAKPFFEDSIAENDLKGISVKIKKLMPFVSTSKDDFLENLSWRLQPHLMDVPKLRTTIDANKSNSDWKSIDPKTINFLSSLTSLIDGLSIDERQEFIEFFVIGKKELPQKVYENFYKQIEAKILKINISSLGIMQSQINKNVLQLKKEIEFNSRNLSMMQKIPVIQVLLMSQPNFDIDHNLWKNLKTQFLSIADDTAEHVLLHAFLKVIPQHEKTASMAYMLSRKSDVSSSSLASLFELFSTVGIKAAQLAAVLNMFGDRSKELSSAKDSVPAPLLQEISETILKAKLLVDSQKIQLEKVLGGASIKAAIKAKLPDGTPTVVMVKRPGAENKVRTHLAIAKKFVSEIRAQKSEFITPMFAAIVNSLDEILSEEMRFELEMEKFAKVKELAQIYQQSNKSSWNIKVPSVLKNVGYSDDVYFLEFMEGETLQSLSKNNKLSSGDAEAIGKLIVDFNLTMFFQYGLFDPDRHRGNFLIDIKSKTVIYIDPGQLSDFEKQQSSLKWDIRLSIAKLIENIVAMKASETVEYALMLSKDSQMTPAGKQKLKLEISELFNKNKGQSNQMQVFQDVLDLLYKSNLNYDWKVTFGALKGLILLAAEQYVTPEQFKTSLQAHISKLYITKLPVLGWKWLGSGYSSMVDKGKSILNLQSQKPLILKCRNLF